LFTEKSLLTIVPQHDVLVNTDTVEYDVSEQIKTRSGTGESMEAIKARVSEDPFVAENVVNAQIIEIEPKKVEDRLSFLLT